MSSQTNVPSINVPSIKDPNANYSLTLASSVINFPPINMDIARRIASFNGPQDLVNFGMVNHYHLKELLPYPPLWDSFLRQHFPDSYAQFKSTDGSLVLYKHLTNVARYMETEKYRLRTLNGHQGPISCIEIVDGKIISGSRDRTIKIWDPETGKEPKTLTGHNDSIWTIAVCGDKIVSGSFDGTIKIWDLKTGKELKTLTGHNDRILSITVYRGKIISGSRDRTIKIWNLETGKELNTLTGHDHLINTVAVYNDKIISGSWDKTIKIWDLETGKERMTLKGHNGPINTVAVYRGKIISGSEDNTIKIWDLETGKELKTLTGHKKSIWTVAVSDGKIISGSFDSTIKIWDLKTGEELNTLTGHNNPVFTVKVCGGKIISGSYDNTIKIRDFNNLSLSPYSKQVLEENLDILGKMADGVAVKEFAEDLHPDFLERLRQHAFKHPDSEERLRQHAYKVGIPFYCSAAVISRVQTEVCVEALLDAIHRGDDNNISQLLHQLIEVDSKNTQIYDILWNVCGKPKFDRWGEYAFHHQQGCEASYAQKEESVIAFKKVLKDRWGEDAPLLLADLGIATEKQYSRKLKRTSDFLLKIGIASPDDLKALFSSSDFQQIQVNIYEQAAEDSTEFQNRVIAKKEVIFAHLHALFTAAQQKSEEAKLCSVRRDENGNVYEVVNPWTAFQKKLSEFTADLNLQREAPKELLTKFSQKFYAEIVKEVNALTDELRTLEREQQIAILYAYSNQVGILTKWNSLHSQGIHSLADLLKQNDAPQDIFNMGDRKPI